MTVSKSPTYREAFRFGAPALALLFVVACSRVGAVAQPAALVTLRVSPENVSLPVGLVVSLVATGVYDDGTENDVTGLVSWSVERADVARVSPGGLVTGVAPGVATLRASLGSLSATVSLVVTGAVQLGFQVTPATARIPRGATQQFIVEGVLYSDGHLGPAPDHVFWASARPEIVAVDKTGLGIGVGTGSVNITASLGELVGSAGVEGLAPAAVALVLDPPTATVPLGRLHLFQVTSTLLSDGSFGPPPPLVQWASTATTVAIVDSTGLASTLRMGVTDVIATSGGTVGRASLSVMAPTPEALLISPVSLTLAKGTTQTLEVVGVRLSDQSVIAPSAPASFRSLAPSIASVDANGFVSAHAQGATTLAVTSSNLAATVAVQVGPAILTSLAISPVALRIPRGIERPLFVTGTFTDGTIQDLTGQAAWRSESVQIARVSTTGHVHALSAGVTQIVAQASGLEASVPCTVLPQRVIFATSTHGSGDLSSWPAAHGKTGLNAADEICATQAASGGLPGQFRAWISGSQDDAYCRIHGLPGKRLDNCGQSALPATAGPWVRTDGHVFVESLEDLMAGRIRVPIRYDEHGGLRPLDDWGIFTSTVESGAAYTRQGFCEEWTSSVVGYYAQKGSAEATTREWTIGDGISCGAPGSLICMEIGNGKGPDAVAVRRQGKTAFLSSQYGHGDLGRWPQAQGNSGVAAGDSVCNTLSKAAGLPGSYRAVLGSGTTGPLARLPGDGPWVRLDGEVIAQNRAELVSGRLQTPLNQDELGAYHDWGVWTGGLANGGPSGQDCLGWTNSSQSATGSSAPSAETTRWLDMYGLSLAPDCAGLYNIYCFEQ